MTRRLTGWVGIASVAVVSVLVATPDAFQRASSPRNPAALDRRPSPQPASAAVAEAPEYRALLTRYCVGCHNEKLVTAGLSLEKIDLGNVHENAEVLEKVLRKVHTGAMPPDGRPRPDAATSRSFVGWLETSLDNAALTHPNPGRVPAIHRLNRTEYANAIRDLLTLHIDADSLLPADDQGFGFDNIADVLSVSPVHAERYLSAALKISRLAVGDTSIRPATDTFVVNKYLKQEDRITEDQPFGSRGGISVKYDFPVDGDYIVKIFLLRTYQDRIRGLNDAHEMEVRYNGARVRRVTVGQSPAIPEPTAAAARGADDGNFEVGTNFTSIAGSHASRARGNVARTPSAIPAPAVPSADAAPASTREGNAPGDVDGMEVRFSAKAGFGTLTVDFVKEPVMSEGMVRPIYPITSYDYAGDSTISPGVARIELRGPYDVKGSGESASRQRIFICRPRNSADETPCAKQILGKLARRAFRRPVTGEDLEPLLHSYASSRAEGSFDGAIQTALRGLLASPNFLFRAEHEPSNLAQGTAYEISDIELASRLSFFLWSSIPDDELLDVAARGQLRKPAVLEQQVRRMLADERSKALVTNFAGQWLYLRNIRLKAPDPNAFPDFDENLRQAFEREMELFLDSQLREDHSITELLTADYTFVNERLAKHYGIPNIYGDGFRRVTLTEEARKGLLGKGGILMVTSYPHRTAPTLRGKWLLENLLGAPPPPPPPNVPALAETGEAATNLSMRERMERHRKNPVCAGCHKQMDPLGFALENFDAIGRWRTTSESGTAIDASGVLANGAKVDGPVTLRQAILANREDFVATATERLLTYAMGRGTEYYDLPAIRKIVRQAAADDYRWSSLIRGVAQSLPFRMRMTEGRAAISEVRKGQ